VLGEELLALVLEQVHRKAAEPIQRPWPSEMSGLA
jgi:hypothetical protein